jgi:hypothetical protein
MCTSSASPTRLVSVGLAHGKSTGGTSRLAAYGIRSPAHLLMLTAADATGRRGAGHMKVAGRTAYRGCRRLGHSSPRKRGRCPSRCLLEGLRLCSRTATLADGGGRRRARRLQTAVVTRAGRPGPGSWSGRTRLRRRGRGDGGLEEGGGLKSTVGGGALSSAAGCRL